MRLLIIYNVLIYSRLHSDWRTWSCPPSPVPPPPDAPAQREEKRVKRPHHASHEPLRRFSPTDKARSRQRRARFQHRTTSSLPSCRATQHFTSVRYQLQLQTCTRFTPTTHHTAAPICADRYGEIQTEEGAVSASRHLELAIVQSTSTVHVRRVSASAPNLNTKNTASPETQKHSHYIEDRSRIVVSICRMDALKHRIREIIKQINIEDA